MYYILHSSLHVIQIWHFVVSNINCYRTLKNDVVRGACTEGNIIFQSAIKIDIARNHSALFVLLYGYCSFKFDNLKNYENVNIIDMFSHYQPNLKPMCYCKLLSWSIVLRACISFRNVMIYLFNLEIYFPNSLPNHDFTRSPNFSEFLVSIHFCWAPFHELKLRI